jgi:AcrR family transcriptional regulator
MNGGQTEKQAKDNASTALEAAMNLSRHGRRGRRGYHHGNLREALIRAALELISEKGPAGFTFAEAARQAGVSPAAPYRHFRDREALVVDVAQRGFELFEAALDNAWDQGRPTPLAALERLGRAYLQFARSKPAHYAAMFEAGMALDANPELRRASDLAFAILRNACEAVTAAAPANKRPPALMMALHIWSLAHGIVALFARGDAARRPAPMSPIELLESAILIYLQGIGALGPRPSEHSDLG